MTSSFSPVTAPGVPLLRVERISKTFAGVKALDDVSLEIYSGEVLAIVGQNGCGKSTLVKILAGIHRADPGGLVQTRSEDGELVAVDSGQKARSVHFIHQDLGLLPMLSTTENLSLGTHLGRKALLPLRRATEQRQAASVLRSFGVLIDVCAPVATLSAAERAIVAIARAMHGWARPDNVLVLDEPTTAFHAHEVQRLFVAVRRAAANGAGIIFISHRLQEVRELADRVVALRDGRVVACAHAPEMDERSMVDAIVGATLTTPERPTATREGPVKITATAHQSPQVPLLTVEGLAGKRARQVSFSVGAGEIVGFSGVLGSGREELLGLVYGREKPACGTVRMDGRLLPSGDIPACIAHGMAYVPADRQREGGISLMSMRENLTLPSIGSLRRFMLGVDRRREMEQSVQWAYAIGLRPPQPDRRFGTFSGGNQQKIVLAKWLRTTPRLLLLDEPTQGVDVGAKSVIYRLVRAAADEGAAVVLCSSDAKEVAFLCDRAFVMQDGAITGQLSGSSLSEANLLNLSLSPLTPLSTTHSQSEGPVAAKGDAQRWR